MARFPEAPYHAEGRKRPHPRHPRPARASELLPKFLEAHPHEQITLGQLIAVLGDRAFGALLLVFALPNLIPVPLPGLSTVLGIPMLLLSVQLMLGQQRPWLPKRLAGRTLPRDTVERLAARTSHWLKRVEGLLKPRLSVAAEGPGERLVGFWCLVMAAVLCLPIVFGNWLPAFAICLMAVGLIEKDGVLVLLGGFVGVVALAVVASLIGAVLAGTLALIRQF